ncbi:MAG: membrane protein insertase YidC [Bacteroidales bacterium]|nr:membrane protein insertase YidC [Bacteroidales bacterium]
MDKNTLIGFSLMAVVLAAMAWINQPTPEQTAARQRYQDSIKQIELAEQINNAVDARNVDQKTDNSIQHMLDTISSDSLKAKELTKLFGAFGKAAIGTDTIANMENEVLKLSVSTKGGRIRTAQLKKYQTHDSLPLILFDGDEASFNTTYVTADNRIINTSSFFFEPLPIVSTADSTQLTMRLSAGTDSYIDHVYTMYPKDYMIRFSIRTNNMASILSPGVNSLDMEWDSKLRQQEKGRTFEKRYVGLFYKYAADDDVENLSESKDDSEELSSKTKWIAYKDQFFSTILIAEEPFLSADIASKVITDETSPYLSRFSSKMTAAFDPQGKVSNDFRIYLGPNHYPTLGKYDKGLASEDKLEIQRLVPLGNVLFRWFNKMMVIPLFDFLGKYINSFGIIIFLLTLIIKTILFPLTYKSYISSAKMRVLRPQVEEINERLKGDDKAMERQKATMELYSRAGASPMSGCLPMLLQMPILFALFMFFPSAIELRQEPFLWANDLSTYDAIFSWEGDIPLISYFYGNHVSLFCLLMTAVNIVYTKFNMDMTNTGQQQMPGMKWMMYLMPVTFLVFFNQYSSGLCYYYLLSSLISIGQTLIFRYSINEEKLLAKLEENKKRPRKTNGFMNRLMEAQKQQQETLRKQQAQRGKRK